MNDLQKARNLLKLRKEGVSLAGVLISMRGRMLLRVAIFAGLLLLYYFGGKQSGTLMVIGLIIGATLQDIGWVLSGRKSWPFTEKVTDWAKVEHIARGEEDPLEPLTDELLESLAFEVADDSYAVAAYNDDRTPMDFVVIVLESYFKMDEDTAIKTMLKIHEEGSVKLLQINKGAGDQLADVIMKEASNRDYPLKCAAVNI